MLTLLCSTVSSLCRPTHNTLLIYVLLTYHSTPTYRVHSNVQPGYLRMIRQTKPP